MKGLVLGIVLSIVVTLNISPIIWAADLGCCEIQNVPNNGILLFEDKTEEECDFVKSINKHSIFHRYQQVAPDKKSCADKDIAEQAKRTDQPIYFTPAVGIPSSDFVAGQPIKVQESTRTLANYIVAIFKYSLGVIGIIAAIALMVGGIVWLTASGNHERISSAKTIIGGGLAGLCIAFTAFLLLSLVNTNLVNLKITPIQKLAYTPIPISGCCKKYSQNPLEKQYTTTTLAEDQCEKLKEQIGPDGYKDIAFIPYAVAKNDECDLLGCCTLSGGSQIRQYIMYESECKKRLSTGGLAEGFGQMTQEQLKDKNIGDACVSQNDLTN